MSSNNYRFDLSDRLIHFFREIDSSSDDAPSIPEHFAFNSFVEGEKYPAFFLLRSAIRMHRLWATWSVRDGVRRIYGPRPAVCFSEMPLAAVLESSRKRETKDKKMSTYGLTFDKVGLHDQGANPVIYGLTNRHVYPPKGKDGGKRILREEQLSLDEQYRLVIYAPSPNVRIDWTHEREWRWPLVEDFETVENELEEFGIVSDAHDIPGLDIGSKKLAGIGVIVKTEEEPRYVTHDILTLIDRKKVGRYHFQHVLVTDLLPSIDELYDPAKVQEATYAAMVDFDEHFDFSKSEVKKSEAEFAKWVGDVEDGADPIQLGQGGGCWLWLLDNSHPFVRCLLQAGRVVVNKEGRYLAQLKELDSTRNVWQRNKLAQKIAATVRNMYAIPCDYFSITGSDDPDDAPFDVGKDFLENRSFYNIASSILKCKRIFEEYLIGCKVS